EIGKRDADVPGRVVDEHVETAEVLGHRLHRGRDGLGLGLIEGDAERATPQRLHHRAGLARRVLALEIGDGDVRPRSREGTGDGRAEEPGTSGDERDAALEIHDGGEIITTESTRAESRRLDAHASLPWHLDTCRGQRHPRAVSDYRGRANEPAP